MRTMLEVPYHQKDIAKKLGARWNPAVKKWFIEDVEDLTPFMRWMPKNLKKPWNARVRPKSIDVKCDCGVPPWEICKHSFQEILDDEYSAMRKVGEFV